MFPLVAAALTIFAFSTGLFGLSTHPNGLRCPFGMFHNYFLRKGALPRALCTEKTESCYRFSIIQMDQFDDIRSFYPRLYYYCNTGDRCGRMNITDGTCQNQTDEMILKMKYTKPNVTVISALYCCNKTGVFQNLTIPPIYYTTLANLTNSTNATSTTMYPTIVLR